jgi:hypothetical protein
VECVPHVRYSFDEMVRVWCGVVAARIAGSRPYLARQPPSNKSKARQKGLGSCVSGGDLHVTIKSEVVDALRHGRHYGMTMGVAAAAARHAARGAMERLFSMSLARIAPRHPGRGPSMSGWKCQSISCAPGCRRNLVTWLGNHGFWTYEKRNAHNYT